MVTRPRFPILNEAPAAASSVHYLIWEILTAVYQRSAVRAGWTVRAGQGEWRVVRGAMRRGGGQAGGRAAVALLVGQQLARQRLALSLR